MFEKIAEGKAEILIPVEKKVSKKLPVFYNPVMKFNRDVSSFLLNSLGKKDMQIALPLSGTGVRGIRLMKELGDGIIKNITFNDKSETSVNLIKNNLENNNLNAEIKNMDANEFLLSYNGFDYIDIDPFGSPNPFLASAILRISRDGILAVTATDTSALSGTYTNACIRKYWARPLRNELMHEIGLRILIRKVQMIGANFDKALIPILSYSKDHYMRIFFKCEKGKKKADDIMKQHKYIIYDSSMDFEITAFPTKEKQYAGPLYAGKLNDKKLLKNILKNIDENYENYEFLKTLSEEVEEPFFYDMHILSKKYKLQPRSDELIEKLKRSKFKASRTHFTPKAIKTNANIKEIIKIINNQAH